MTRDQKFYLFSLISVLAIIVLSMFYTFGLPDSAQLSLWNLIEQCIPSAIVAIAALPIIYFFFYLPGLVALNGRFRNEDEDGQKGGGLMGRLPAEIERASLDTLPVTDIGELLIVVDPQKDFVSGQLRAHEAEKVIPKINSVIQIATRRNAVVVFTKDWHPVTHWSFDTNGGPWPQHCIINTKGAEFADSLIVPDGSTIFEFGVTDGSRGYSPLENLVLKHIVESHSIQRIYVVGIALEYCIQATCLACRELNKETHLIIDATASASEKAHEIEEVKSTLSDKGIILTTISNFGRTTT